MTKLDPPVPGQPGTVYIEHPPQPFVETGGVAGGPVLISVPHSGRYYPRELVEQVRLPIDDLRMLEDLLVDHLIEEAIGRNVHTITNNYARAWIDLNRRETELDPRQLSPRPAAHIDQRSPRVVAGLGLIPLTSGSGRALYDGPLAMDMIASRIERVHRPYHARIAAGLGAMKERFGAALLCDLHSMPPLPAAQAADIVLGDRHGRTAAPALVDTAAAWLTQQGYRVTRNRPYAGGHSVELHGRPERACHAIQIEFDRQLYLESDGRTLSRNAPGVARLIAGLARVLQECLDTDSGTRLAAE
ncbi:hypothetical protein BSL82_05915 [Tardibacter chloracetimidivorans]|uniref:N-formylglutamate amidohydrolase n=1 Tax=Tardibacter chloracetimidivorans TaxID=1921510 RepID=A0A1L3ZTE5_9SPHN|nr:N-formylglutamate amidohydrolase [Tardibacter chloracetimidivorans]API58904.1 hypothetical protein BSL82_05915 [Tardibacter chloracetimidivorans]